MDYEASMEHLLECMLTDPGAEPTDLPMSLLNTTTNNFSDHEKIGRGGFADVYKGELPNGALIAVKKLFHNLDMEEENFIKEVGCLMKAKHKNIVRFLGYCSDTQGKILNHEGKMIHAEERHRLLCFEFLPKGSLDNYITDVSEGLEWRTRYKIIKGICEGLHYLHQDIHIVHSDLKPANILLDENMVPKIADFGLARCFDEKQSKTMTSKVMGTVGYMAPEFYDGVITFKSDIYSLGIIIMEILTGWKGYCDIQKVLQRWSIRFESSQEGIWLQHVQECAEIGNQCIHPNPEVRPDTLYVIRRLDEMERTCGFIETNICTSSETQMEIDTTRSSDQPLQTSKVIDEQEFIITTPGPSHPSQEQTSEEIYEQKPAAVPEPCHQVEMEIDTTQSNDRQLQTSKEIGEQEFIISTPKTSHPLLEQTIEEICEQKPAAPLLEPSHQVEETLKRLMEMDTARSSDRPGQTSKEICKQESIISQVPNHTAEEMVHSMRKSILGSIMSKAASATKVFLHKASKKRQGYFEQHGARMLLRILQTDGNMGFTIYDGEDLVKATRGFHKSNIIGEGAHGTVYKAILGTTIVAVKRCKQIDKSRTEEFVQELVVLCRVSHPNIVRLLGCCLHFEAPMLVYEFVPNGTLSSLLHGGCRRPVKLSTRLRIAAEIAEALAHLHSPPHPTLHGDIKPENILLGEGWEAKVSDFGCSTINDNVQVVPKGTLAYLDPEFLQDAQITEKTDVYSFGVVLIELLTGKNPQARGWKNLIRMFQNCMANGTVGDLLDADIVEEGSVGLIYAAAKLVSRCIAVPGKARPAMAEVAVELQRFSYEMPESHEARVALEVEVDRHSCTASTEGGTTGSYSNLDALSTELAR